MNARTYHQVGDEGMSMGISPSMIRLFVNVCGYVMHEGT